MMRWPRTLFARLMLIWVLGISVVLAVSVSLIQGERERVDREVLVEGMAREFAAGADVLEPLSPLERDDWLHTLGQRRMRFALTPPPVDAAPLPPHFSIVRAFQSAQPDRSVSLLSLPQTDPDGDTRRAGRLIATAQLADGAMLSARLPASSLRPERQGAPLERLIAALAALLVGISLLAWIGVRVATRPLSRLAAAARALGENPENAQVDPGGPLEVAQAATAFRQMQARIREHVSERMRILAAISHDLQTPITRLRLRVEQVEDEALRQRISADLDSMQALVREGLDYARSLEEGEPLQSIDLTALLETLCDDAHDMGWQVALSGQTTAPCRGRHLALRRALWNLIENGVKFGDRVDVHVVEDDTHWHITIRDHGTGLSDEMLEHVFEPFFRMEGSRSRDTGGTGLGLAIARNLLRNQGGEVHLENAPDGGLVARVRLPR